MSQVFELKAILVLICSILSLSVTGGSTIYAVAETDLIDQIDAPPNH